MYSAESVHSRFAAHPPHSSNADHSICVVYSGGWKYDTNSALYTFTPRSTDILVAAVNFSGDTVSSLEGQDSTLYGIAYGYASGDLTFEANKWNGVYNYGEFSISGTTLTPNDSWAITTKYYYAAGARVAMNRDGVVYYLHTDHLGSTSLTTNASGGVVAEQRYYPYGEERWASGTLPTDRRFTGQRWEQGLGLYDYNARWYHPYINRWISPDTIVPDPANPQSLNRYSYVLGNPLKYQDPTGHAACVDDECNYVYHPVTGDIVQRRPAESFPVLGPGRPVSDEAQKVSNTVNILGAVLDTFAFGIGLQGALLEDGMALAGGTAAPLGLAAYVSTLDKAESTLGIVGLGLTIVGDIIGGYTYLDREVRTNGMPDFVIGQDTTIELCTATAGAMIPEANIDTYINVRQMVYSWQQVPEEPTMEVRLHYKEPLTVVIYDFSDVTVTQKEMRKNQ